MATNEIISKLNELTELRKMAEDLNAEIEAMRSLNDIGTCLYEFRRHIKALQEAHYKASTQTQEA